VTQTFASTFVRRVGTRCGLPCGLRWCRAENDGQRQSALVSLRIYKRRVNGRHFCLLAKARDVSIAA
jgi:hypothetical protein